MIKSIYIFTSTTKGPPPIFTYPSLTLIRGKQIPRISPTVQTSLTSGEIVSFVVTPYLPAGLFLDSSNGVIFGAPTTTFDSTAFTVTAANTGGTRTFTFLLVVVEG